MSFESQVTLNDPGSAGGSSDAILVSDLQQALDEFSRYIAGIGTLAVELTIVQSAVGRADGGPTSSYFVGTSGELNVFAPSSLYELTNGQHENGITSDITINVSPSYFDQLDLSRTLGYYSTPAADELNPVIVFMHELMHGFGLGSDRSQDGSLPGNYETTYDALTQIHSDGSAWYDGYNGETAEGGPVRITTSSTTQNYSHFGNTLSDFTRSSTTVEDPLTLDLMNGVVFFYGYHYPISRLDLGVLKDLGYSLRNPAAIPSDFSGDGISDVLYRDTTNGDTGFYRISNGVNVGWTDIGATSTSYSPVGSGDFIGNAAADVLFHDATTGDTGFYQIVNGNTVWRDIGASSTAYGVVGVGDYNGDGTSDILFRDNASGDTGFYQLTNGLYAGWHDVGLSSTAYTVVASDGDFNGDGTSDILYRNNANGDTGFYEIINGANTGWHDIGASSTSYAVVGVGDFNGDGSSDVLFRSNLNGDTGFYQIVDGLNSGWHDVGASSTAYSIVGSGDYNGDGTSDILFRDSATGDTGFYNMINGANAGWVHVGASSAAYHVIG